MGYYFQHQLDGTKYQRTCFRRNTTVRAANDLDDYPEDRVHCSSEEYRCNDGCGDPVG